MVVRKSLPQRRRGAEVAEVAEGRKAWVVDGGVCLCRVIGDRWEDLGCAVGSLLV